MLINAVLKSERKMQAATEGMSADKASDLRNIVPVIDYDKCTGCMICLKCCPDISIKNVSELPFIIYDICSSCGICSVECPENAIGMVPEDR